MRSVMAFIVLMAALIVPAYANGEKKETRRQTPQSAHFQRPDNYCWICRPGYDESPGVNVMLRCIYEPGKNEVCCWAELTEAEWRHCPTHSYFFSTKAHPRAEAFRVNARAGWVCKPEGHANVSYRTSTGRHLIARFRLERDGK